MCLEKEEPSFLNKRTSFSSKSGSGEKKRTVGKPLNEMEPFCCSEFESNAFSKLSRR